MNLHRSLALALAFSFLGCAGQLRQVRSYPAPLPSELLAALETKQKLVQGVSMEARATSWLGGERVRGIVQMLALRDGHLRFEAEVTLQGTVAALAVRGGDFTFLDHQKHEWKHGAACPANIASLLRIPLRAEEVAAILLGDAPRYPTPTKARVEWDDLRGADLLVLPGEEGVLWWVGFRRVHPQQPVWDLVFLEGLAKGKSERWRVSYEDPERVAGVALPRVIRFAEPGKSFDEGLEIKVRERSVNPLPPETAFTLAPPMGYRTLEIGCPAPL